MNVQHKNLLKAVKLLEKEQSHNDKWTLDFHLMPKTGWMNDPNGLCQFKGTYHIFFQYSPFDVTPGINYWGHYTTKNFVDYEYHEPALCCDQSFDCHGVYSGSALIDDGKMYIYYTGNVKQAGNHDYTTSGREHNTILVTSDDGIHFSEKQELMTNRDLKTSDYPHNLTCHVRDPKVFKLDGKYYMVLGARTTDDAGEVLVYTSEDRVKWTLLNTLKTKLGYMWECPDLFSLGGKSFLSVSPQGVEAEGYKFNNVHQSGYMQIEGDFRSEYKLGEFVEYDMGFDFYAPQTFTDEQGRRILIAWIGLPDGEKFYQNPTTEYGWIHCLSMPRLLSEKNGRIVQKPLPEYEKLRRSENKTELDNGVTVLSDYNVFEADVAITETQNAEIDIRNVCKLKYNGKVLTLSMNEKGYGRKERSVELSKLTGLHIFCDRSVVEIFVNDGEEVFTSRFYPEENDKGIVFAGIIGKATVYELGGFSLKG